MEHEIVYQLTLEWAEADRRRSQTVSPVLAKLVTIGRDPGCDVVLNDPTRSVSGMHAGLYLDPKTLKFYIRNLTRDR
ncbi:FHA domain-containing protein, partial [Synechococcus sp. H55.9]